MHPFTISKFRGGWAVTFYDLQGKRRRFALTEKSKKNATPEAVEIVTEFFKKRPEDVTTDDVCEAYLKSLGNRPAAERMGKTKAVRKFFGPYKPEQITEQLVMDYRDNRVHALTGKPISQVTLWTELGALRDAFNYAKKRRIIAAEDVPFIPRPPQAPPRDRPLSKEEAFRLLQASKEVRHLYITILLLLGTGGRISAVLELEWARVNFAADTIDLRLDTENPRKGRAKVPMNKGLKNELLKWKEVNESPYVVSYADKPVKSIKKAFTSAVTRGKLTNIRIHDLRHTAAVWMLEAGSSIQRISQFLGHSSLDQTFKVYARYQPNFLRAEAAALDVTALLRGDFSKQNGVESKISEAIAIELTSSKLSITVDRTVEPEFAIFLKERADTILDDLRQDFDASREKCQGHGVDH